MSADRRARHAARPGQPHRAPGDGPRGAVEDRGVHGAVRGAPACRWPSTRPPRRTPRPSACRASAKGNVEGYLFPATYEFDADAGATTQLRTMVAKALAQLRAAGVAPADAQRVLTVASIVEAEARRDADRGKVARVVENRLASAR